MCQFRTVICIWVTLLLVSILVLLVWNFTPIYKIVPVLTILNSNKNLLRDSGKTDFYQVPNREVYIYKKPAIFVNTKNMYIISVGFVKKGNYKQQLICLQELKNGTTVKSGVNVWELPTTSQAKAYKYHSAFIHCEGVSESDMPVQISILPTDKPEAGRYWLDVIDRRNHTKPAQDGIAVCVNSIYNYKSATTIIEWMEVQKLMKVDKVYIYGYRNVSKSVEEVINYYQKSGSLQVLNFHHGFPRFHETFSRRAYDLRMSRKHHNLDLIEDTHNQFAAYNDCLYRFGSLHKYLAFIDLDEFIVATNKSEIYTYSEILAPRKAYNTLYFSQVRFCVPGWLHLRNSESPLSTNASRDLFSSNIYRTPPLSNLRKVIIKSSEIKVFGVHEPYQWWGRRHEFTYPISEAKKQHYKHKMYNMVRGQDKCLIKDNSMLPFQKPLEKSIRATVERIITKIR